jgi:GGDEF domain-containing protein
MASGMTFLLFDEEYQYGVLNAMIEPDKIDFCYMLSLDIGTSLRYMDLWAQQKRYRAELQALARTDALTGLNNRAGVIHERAQMIGRRSRRAGVILADLDHLKQINDRFGHQAGDMALKAAADILREAVREAGAGSFQPGQGNDTNAESFQPHPENGGARVQENDKNAEGAPRQILGRFGGDEFISYCVDMTSEQIAAQLTRIRELCDRFNESSDLPYYVEISAGFAVGKVRRIEDWEKLVERADAQLYEAKKTRREFVVRGRQP